ncbi:MAG: hypothetical protein HZR80_03190 [Candidatus Heimdallarchaeota archaeon]
MVEKIPPIIRFKRKIGKMGDSMRMTIPKEIIDTLTIEEGEVWEIYAKDDDTIIMERITK